MPVIIPDPRFEMPELFEPNRIPAGALVVTDDTALFFIVQDGKLIDIAQNQQVIELGNSGARIGSNGAYYESNATNNDQVSYIPLDEMRAKYEFSSVSIIIRCKARTDGVFGKVVYSTAGRASGFYLRIDTSSSDRAAVLMQGVTLDQSYNYPVTNFAETSEYHTYGISCDGDKVVCYKDGIFMGESSGGGGGIYYRSLFDISDSLTIGGNSASNAVGDFDILYAREWDRVLNAEEHRMFALEPFTHTQPA